MPMIGPLGRRMASMRGRIARSTTKRDKTIGIGAGPHAASRILARLVGGWAGRCAERAETLAREGLP